MKRIALIGDSHAQALWPRVKAKLELAGHDVVLTSANPGWSEAKYATSGIESYLQNAHPDVVVFELGGNNRDFDTSSYVRTVGSLVKAAEAAGATKVIWVGPPTSTSTVFEAMRVKTRAMQAQVLPKLGVVWIDTQPMTASGHGSDGVHFTTAGYAAWAEALTPKLEAAMTSSGPSTAVWVGVAAFSLAVAALVRQRIVWGKR